MQKRYKMNTPVVVHSGGVGTDSRAKLIQGLGLTELILGFLCMVIAVIYGNLALKHASPAGVPFWTSLTSPTALKALHLVWTIYLTSFFLIWHGSLCRRLQRPLRPIGFAVGTLLSLKFAYIVISLCFMRSQMDFINVTVNNSTVNFGSRFGIYLDFIICAVAALAALTTCFSAFSVSQQTKRTLETVDQAQYTLDSIPLSVFLGVVLFICLSYSYLADVIHPSLLLVGIHLSTLMKQAILLTIAVGCALAAWAFYTQRPWGWFAGLLIGVAWAVTAYYPPDDMSVFSGPEFDKYRDFIAQITPAFQKYIQFNDILMFVSLIGFSGYLIYVRRHLGNGKPPFGSHKGSRPEVPIHADWRRLKMLNKSWLIFGSVGVLQWLQHDYFIALLFVAIAILIMVLMLISIFTPRYVFREEGLAFTGISLLATPVFPYASFKSVQLITTFKPPKGMRSIENGVLNLNVSMFADDQRARLEEEFRKRDIEVTVLAPAAAAS